jgi:hypothetical protein
MDPIDSQGVCFKKGPTIRKACERQFFQLVSNTRNLFVGNEH